MILILWIWFFFQPFYENHIRTGKKKESVLFVYWSVRIEASVYVFLKKYYSGNILSFHVLEVVLIAVYCQDVIDDNYFFN